MQTTPRPLQEVSTLLRRAAEAPAEPPAELADTVRAANAANAAGDFAAACSLFDEAFALSGRLPHLLSGANMRLKLKRPASAAEAFQYVLTQKNVPGDHADYAARRLREATHEALPAAARAGRESSSSIGGAGGGGAAPGGSLTARMHQLSASDPTALTPRSLAAHAVEVEQMHDHMAAALCATGAAAASASASASPASAPTADGVVLAPASSQSAVQLSGQLARVQALLQCERRLRLTLRDRLATQAVAEALTLTLTRALTL